MQNNVLIIVAHGSRKESSNAEVMTLGAKIKPLVTPPYDAVKIAFLEFAQPSLEESILASIKEGVSDLVILPYFLASGNHVTRDIPAVVQEIKAHYPEVNIELKEHLGSAQGMVALLSSIAR